MHGYKCSLCCVILDRAITWCIPGVLLFVKFQRASKLLNLINKQRGDVV